MENTTEHLLEMYFANALSPAKVSALQKLIAEDPVLRAEYDWQKNLAHTLRTTSLRDSLQDDTWRHASVPTKKPAIRRRLYLVSFAAAASIALLVAAVLFFSNNPVEDALATNLTHYPNRMDFKSLGGPEAGQEAPPVSVRHAFELYDDSTNYHRSAEALGAVVQQYPDRLAYRFYYGYALLRDKNYAAAIANLLPVANTDSTTFQAAALYHLGLAYAGAKQYGQARTTLQQFLNSPNTLRKYQAGAEAVLRALPKE